MQKLGRLNLRLLLDLALNILDIFLNFTEPFFYSLKLLFTLLLGCHHEQVQVCQILRILRVLTIILIFCLILGACQLICLKILVCVVFNNRVIASANIGRTYDHRVVERIAAVGVIAIFKQVLSHPLAVKILVINKVLNALVISGRVKPAIGPLTRAGIVGYAKVRIVDLLVLQHLLSIRIVIHTHITQASVITFRTKHCVLNIIALPFPTLRIYVALTH